MKKLFMAMLITLLFCGVSYGANESIEEQVTSYGKAGSEYVEVLFTIVGDDATGAISDTAMGFDAKGYYLYNVETDPGATAPDAADVLVKNAGGRDLLDGQGTNLLHATATQSLSDAMSFYELVTGTLTLDIDNQATASATYTVKLTFIK